jgi:phage host-nuclease inhibitor protein Gam
MRKRDSDPPQKPSKGQGVPASTDATGVQEVSLELIASKLERLKWRHKPMGVDERQVWHVIERLDQMYRQLFREQEIRYQALLERAEREARGSRGGK